MSFDCFYLSQFIDGVLSLQLIYITILYTLSLLIPGLLILVALIIGKKINKNREKLSPFECGFDPIKKARIPFSIRFFLVTIIFLIFDIEVVIILPIGFIIKIAPLDIFSTYIILILILLIFGLLYEWNQGALNWIY